MPEGKKSEWDNKCQRERRVNGINKCLKERRVDGTINARGKEE